MRSRRSTVRVHIVPALGDWALEDVTTRDVEAWRTSLRATLSTRSKNQLTTELHGIFKRAKRVWGLPSNPVEDVELLRERPRVDFEVYSPEEVLALVRFAASEQDAAIFLTAAFTGLRRGELVALRWRDVDFTGSLVRVRRSYSYGGLTVPKSGKARAVPLAPEVAHALARLSTRPLWTGEDDLVFPRRDREFLDGSALRRRYLVAAIGRDQGPAVPRSAPYVRHAEDRRRRHRAGEGVDGTRGHRDDDALLHFAPRPEDAALVAKAFRLATDEAAFGAWAPALMDGGEVPG
jgi:integrase